MAKVQLIFEITPSFAFTEFDFYKDYEESFKKCEIGRIHASFRCMKWQSGSDLLYSKMSLTTLTTLTTTRYSCF